MPELSGFDPTPGSRIRTDRLSRLAARQFGRVAHRQLLELGFARSVIHREVERGGLLVEAPGVYALGHRGGGYEAGLAVGLLHAGQGSALSHRTGSAWVGLPIDPPRRIEISAPGDVDSTPRFRIHHPRDLERFIHNGLPVTPIARLLLDSASLVAFPRLRKALADAEYLRLVTLDEVEAVLGRGKPGSAQLRKALEMHRPELARTKSRLEEWFIPLCESAPFRMPDINEEVEGFEVDAVWWDEMLVVELDGAASHGLPRQIEEDRRRELILRAAGYDVRRYSWQQVRWQPNLVIADICRGLGLPAP